MADPIAGPAESWHRAYFAALGEAGFAPMVSLSYEVLADYCPLAWQQRALDADYARTGWVPPSALLTPAHADAMAWLQAVGARFVGLIEEAGQPVCFQIGEPWWWVREDGHVCIYDAAASARWQAEGLMTTAPGSHAAPCRLLVTLP